MHKNRKNTNKGKPTQLRKINALKVKDCNVNFQNNHKRSHQSTKNSQNMTTNIDGYKIGFHNHFASTSQIIYSPFRKHFYQPPHLCSSQVKKAVFKGQINSGRWRPLSAKKYDYDKLYHDNQKKYENVRSSRKWSNVKSKIKYLLDQDRATYQHFVSPPKWQNFKRQAHPDDDLSEESQPQLNSK